MIRTSQSNNNRNNDENNNDDNNNDNSNDSNNNNKSQQDTIDASTENNVTNKTMIQQQQQILQQQQIQIPNKSLTENELYNKKQLKILFKQQQRLRKYTIRLQQSINRNDPVEQIKIYYKELLLYQQQISNTNATKNSNSSNSNNSNNSNNTNITSLDNININTNNCNTVKTSSSLLNRSTYSTTDTNINNKHDFYNYKKLTTSTKNRKQETNSYNSINNDDSLLLTDISPMVLGDDNINTTTTTTTTINMSIEEYTARTLIEKVYQTIQKQFYTISTSQSTSSSLESNSYSTRIQNNKLDTTLDCNVLMKTTDNKEEEYHNNDENEQLNHKLSLLSLSSSSSSKTSQVPSLTSAPVSKTTNPEEATITNSKRRNTPLQQQQPQEDLVQQPKLVQQQQQQQQKELYNKHSRILCQNMTKGTQTETMFTNTLALIGYTRNKFIERSVLVVQSLCRLILLSQQQQQQEQHQTNTSSSNSNDSISINKSIQIAKYIVQQLFPLQDQQQQQNNITNDESSTTKTTQPFVNVQWNVWSIGCGPGCDAVGIWSFIKAIQSTKTITKTDTLNTSTNSNTNTTHSNSTATNAIDHNDTTNNYINKKSKKRSIFTSTTNSATIPIASTDITIDQIICMDYTIQNWLPILQCVYNTVLDFDQKGVDIYDKNHQSSLQQQQKEQVERLPKVPVTAEKSQIQHQQSQLKVQFLKCDVRQPIFMNAGTTTTNSNNILNKEDDETNKDIALSLSSSSSSLQTNTERDGNDIQNNDKQNTNDIQASNISTEMSDIVEIRHPNETIEKELIYLSLQKNLNITSPSTGVIINNERNTKKDNCTGSNNDTSINQRRSIHWIVISYLLSETRDKWFPFVDDLIYKQQWKQHVNTNTNNNKDNDNDNIDTVLFLITDPTAWQLHVFCNRYKDVLDCIWLDSSMNRIELQTLHARVGPGVLLGVLLQ